MYSIKKRMTSERKKKKVVNPFEEPRAGKLFRLYDFQTFDHLPEPVVESPKQSKEKEKEKPHFRIQMFGVDEQGKTCALFVDNFRPFFYIQKDLPEESIPAFFVEMKRILPPYMRDDFVEARLVRHNKLYDFTGSTEFPFILCTFRNMRTFSKMRMILTEQKETLKLSLYESKIPPLLRYFHIQQISPSGWVKVYDHLAEKPANKCTTCDFEYICDSSFIVPMPHIETPVPYKICSFDIEASSSHGDFPIPIKDYKRLATQLVDLLMNRHKKQPLDRDSATLLLKKGIASAFAKGDKTEQIDVVYTKLPVQKDHIKYKINQLLTMPFAHLQVGEEVEDAKKRLKITQLFSQMAEQAKDLQSSKEETEGGEKEGEEKEEEIGGGFGSGIGEVSFGINRTTEKKIPNLPDRTILDVLLDAALVREQKIMACNEALSLLLPALEGDQITFIGTTFMQFGQKEPYKNHCFCVGSCDPVEGVEIDSVSTERACLVQWAQLIQEENPDIIIGYNIFGFDYEFMFQRAKELNCVDPFLTLSRIQQEVCYKTNYKTGEKTLEQTKNRLASGEYDLHYPKISGRLQIDLLFYFRRDYNLSSYKLDDVAGTFIRDDVKGVVCDGDNTMLYSKNLAGLHTGDFIHLELSSFTTDYYKKGKKFRVVDIQKQVEVDASIAPPGVYNVIIIEGHYPDLAGVSNLKWGMSKDDVTPQDIFRLSKESAKSRAIVAKYCIQDCNLVHHLMSKIDILTGYVEMARICNVPMSFLVFRGQGIKLTSYVAKVCREKNTLMPDLESPDPNVAEDGYEGAIVLPPKCAMYGENPVACVDYSSLYPSIAKGWNLSPDSKVWTKTFDLQGKLLKINDIPVSDANLKTLLRECEKYDNLSNYQYVETEFDQFAQVQRFTATGKLGRKEKVCCGKRVCRWAQFQNGEEGIIPSIIGDLLKARKETRNKAESEKDPFIANVLDKRQLGYKVTANSLYGQMGSAVSTFFEKDVAASITAIGRMMITYAKRMVEEIYGDSLYTNKQGETVRTRSSYVYGDTDSVFFTFNLEDPITGQPIRGTKALEFTIEIAQEAAHLCSLYLPPPMKLTYEKTLMSFILLSKKRYVGMLYEFNPHKGKLKFMGLPLKRRDACDYLKDVYGGILTILMKEPDNIEKAITFLNTSLKQLVDGKISMDKLAITKALRSDYKNPDQIAHKVLSNRMGDRDPGNRPRPGDRIKYVFIQGPDNGKKTLMGERIETLEYVTEKKLKLDYNYYITNQLMNPLQQLLGLALEKIYVCKQKKQKDILEYRGTLSRLMQESNNDLEIYMKKREKYCSAQVKNLLFDPFLTELYNTQHGIQTLLQFYQRKQ
jgi:DNA polymerase elongation subunit (family B)